MNKKDISESFTVELDNDTELRADRYIADYLGLFKRSQIKNRNVRVLLKGKEIKLGKMLNSGDIITVEYNHLPPPDIVPEKIELDIIYEDRNSIVMNKHQGIVVHPGAGNFTGTLVHGLLYHCLDMKDKFPRDDIRPGIVHRLDKDTSGVIISAKNPDALEFLSSQFRNKSAHKSYLAIVKGVPVKPEGRIETFITRDQNNRKKFTVSESRGKKAVTIYKVIKAWNNFSLLHLKLETGRTHQLRVHMLFLGNPILGDSIYGRKSGIFPDISLMLHAYRLSLVLPGDIDKISTFKAPVPLRFSKVVNRLSSSSEDIFSLISLIQD
ncbi:MAG: RluA family pseudouridine synthase [Spirochaetales bacterium]|nr:RluA family pseudouridine synthase [Spirochaetales bacterium]